MFEFDWTLFLPVLLKTLFKKSLPAQVVELVYTYV